MKRRQFLGASAGAALLAVVPSLATAAVAPSRTSPVLAVVDPRLAMAGAFSSACCARGLQVAALDSDMARTWSAHLQPALARGAVVGLTRPAELQVFAMLAHEQGAKLRYRGLHRSSGDMASHQLCLAGDLEACQGLPGDAGWVADAVALACRAADACTSAATPGRIIPGAQYVSWTLS